MSLSPFPGFHYEEPQSLSSEGVLDVSDVLVDASSSPLAASRLDVERSLSMAVADDWMNQGRLVQDSGDYLYLYRSGWQQEGRPQMGGGILGVGPRPSSVGPQQPFLLQAQQNILDVVATHVSHSGAMPIIKATKGNTHYRLWAIDQAGIVELARSLAPPPLDQHDGFGLVALSQDPVPPPIGLVFHLQ